MEVKSRYVEAIRTLHILQDRLKPTDLSYVIIQRVFDIPESEGERAIREGIEWAESALKKEC